MKKFLIGILVSVIILTGIAGTGLIVVGRPLQGILQGGAYIIASDAPTLDRQMGQIFHTFYGARVAVCDGTADQVEIKAAIAALPTDGGKVKLSMGNFQLSANITIDDTSIHLQGEGGGTIIWAAIGMNDSMIVGSGADRYNCKLSDFRMAGRSAN